jgi:PII-like signaling protein
MGLWQKLMAYTVEQARHEGHPLYIELVHRLRVAGANGATALRGIWGYHGDHSPHGDKPFALRRHVPVVTAILDTPERIRQ